MIHVAISVFPIESEIESITDRGSNQLQSCWTSEVVPPASKSPFAKPSSQQMWLSLVSREREGERYIHIYIIHMYIYIVGERLIGKCIYIYNCVHIYIYICPIHSWVEMPRYVCTGRYRIHITHVWYVCRYSIYWYYIYILSYYIYIYYHIIYILSYDIYIYTVENMEILLCPYHCYCHYHLWSCLLTGPLGWSAGFGIRIRRPHRSVDQDWDPPEQITSITCTIKDHWIEMTKIN